MTKVIGILLDPSMLEGIPRGRIAHEHISFYNKAALKYGMSPFYFSLNHVNTRLMKAKGYISASEKKYKWIRLPIPRVIHNRSMTFAKAARHKLTQLHHCSYIYNRQTRYSKLMISRLLSENEFLKPFIPHTRKFSLSHLEAMTSRYDDLFIKPVSGSVGKGIIKIHKTDQGKWEIIKTPDPIRREVDYSRLYKKLARMIGKRQYLIQKAVPLARYHGKPFDIRVSVQRGSRGKWQITGMVGKVAAKGSPVTNVARGGRVRRCEILFAACGLDSEAAMAAVKNLALAVAEELSSKLTHLADLGLDIGIDRKGKPYFIEMNGRDLRYSFQKAGMMKHWYKTYENPVKYGKYLYSKFKKEG